MFEPTEREVDQDVHDSMALFERAQVGEVAPISPRQPHRILLVLDGSTQDDLSIELCRRLKTRFDSALDVLDARESVSVNELAEEAARSLGATAVAKSDDESYEQILHAAAEMRSDLIVVPSPYGRDLEKIGSDSTGTVIDVLLARSPVPLLVIRQPFQVMGEPFARALIVLVSENKAAADAAAWAAGLVRTGGTAELTLVLEQEVLENVRHLIQEVDPSIQIGAEQLTQALAQSHVRLHRALQKTASAAGFQYRLLVRRESEVSMDNIGRAEGPPTDGAEAFIVLALERGDHLSHGHVQDRIRNTRLPVLVVPQRPAAR